MIKNFEEIKTQLKDLSEIVNSFKSEAVQLKIVELVFGLDTEIKEQHDNLRGGWGNLNKGDKWYFCSQSASLPLTRSNHDKTNTPEP